jgi:tetratricopeptide (TPR) repeat protein
MTGRYDQAEIMEKEGKAIQEKILGKNHPDYALSCARLGEIYEITGKYEKAETLTLEAIKNFENSGSAINSQYAVYCADLGRIYVDLKKFAKAEFYLSKAKQKTFLVKIMFFIHRVVLILRICIGKKKRLKLQMIIIKKDFNHKIYK